MQGEQCRAVQCRAGQFNAGQSSAELGSAMTQPCFRQDVLAKAGPPQALPMVSVQAKATRIGATLPLTQA